MSPGAPAAWFERWPLPDAALRIGIWRNCRASARAQADPDATAEAAFVAAMADRPIAEASDTANSQHYELPPEFFALALGPRWKYSCCFYPSEQTTLAEAEDAALDLSIARAGLADGQRVLELGCGWGSLSLTMAARFPASHITAVSNSHGQRRFIEEQAAARGLSNLRVITADMNDFAADGRFDRVVSVEMIEHMANWGALLGRIAGWLEPDGRLFVHHFAHRYRSRRYDHRDPADWIARHFFTGGIMPARDLLHRFDTVMAVEQDWWWDGRHYARTARDWLANFDDQREANRRILRQVYGEPWAIWERRWRLFYLAVAGMFGHAGGRHWGVVHALLRPTAT